MPISTYDVSIADFLHGFKIVTAVLDKGEAHAKENNVSADSYLELRLAPDMLPLPKQITIMSDQAKYAAVRVGGMPDESHGITPETWADLHKVIDWTVKFLEKTPKDAMDGEEDKKVKFATPSGYEFEFTKRDYVLRWAVPNFHFHLTTTYNLLRNKGVQLGKRDFLFPPS